MKLIYATIVYFTVLLFFSCSSNDNKAPVTPSANETTSKPKTTTPSATAAGDDITGDWELIGSVLDGNDNSQVDEEERKNLKAASYKDYMTLNSDGSGLFTVAKIEGRYEINEENGNKRLTWFDKANGSHRVGSIIKVSKQELHIKEPGGSGLIIWKRI